jgi:hypothetical protein
MYPNKQSYMLNDSVNIEKHKKTFLLNTFIIAENAELRKKVRKIKPQASQVTRHQLQLYTVTIKSVNTFKRVLLVIHLIMPATYVIDYGI